MLPIRSRVHAAAPLLVAGGLAAVVLLGIAVATGASTDVDAAVIRLVRSESLVAPLAPLRQVTELGSTWAVSVVAAMALLVEVIARHPSIGLAAALTITGTSLANAGLKRFVARERPDLLDPIVAEHGFSFPSGHSVLAAVACGVVAVLVVRSGLPRAVRMAAVIGLAAVVFGVGLSRVYLGVHYPSDVLAGWLLGAAVVLVFAGLTRGVSTAQGGGAAVADRAAPRSGPPGPG